MNVSDFRNVIALAECSEFPVCHAIACAADNAGQTLLDQGRGNDRFEYTDRYSDEMVRLTHDSLVSLLSFPDSVPDFETVTAWFEAHGVTA